VSTAYVAASVSSAVRHPCPATRSIASGTKSTDANPPMNVSTVSARPRRARNHVATTAKAGS